MVDLPWQRGSEDDDPDPATERVDVSHDDALLTCEFHDGSIAVYADEVVIERAKRSSFEETTIPMADIVDVDYAKGITIGYLQIEVVGVEPDEGGWFSDPVNERTLHFGRQGRTCAREAREEILAHARGADVDDSPGAEPGTGER